ncbi:AAA family ATPase [Oleiharenicola sp. Vm1]|uniref:AAA family ATPase n=1 Tax=Oleiharenicola sp. Vm1 TaxID=3398393 RepID=UPI0039F576C7
MIASSPMQKRGAQHERWLSLVEHINRKVVGQPEAAKRYARAILAGEMGLTRKGRPRSFLIKLGPTGTGKTSMTVAASELLYGTDAIIRLNMAEFQEKRDLARLLGENRNDNGYLGDELDRLRKAGGHMLLVDEIEKAHKDIANVFLGMEGATVTMANGKTYYLDDIHCIVTSNLGSADAMEMGNLPYALVAEHIEQEAMTHFRPEVWARFTDKIVFRGLTYRVQEQIARDMLTDEARFQSARLGREIVIGDGVFRFIVAQGFHETLGARPMRNTVEYHVRAGIVEKILECLAEKGIELPKDWESEESQALLKAIVQTLPGSKLRLELVGQELKIRTE